MTITAQPKGKTRAQLKAARDRIAQQLDRAENAKVVERSEGQCEVWMGVGPAAVRCRRRAIEIHHLIGGWRLRGRGQSATAEAKLHVCRACHRDLTEHRLRRIGGVTPHYTDCYERVR